MENGITYTATSNKADLAGVLALQTANLKKNLSREEIEANGFVTVEHHWKTLASMAEIEPQIVAKHNEKVVGYVLAMTKASRFDIPVILPMFAEFEKITYRDRIVAGYDYMVVGQACVHKDYRGTGIIEGCYRRYRETFAERYDFAITEIAASNLRSVKAHKKVGFEEIHVYKDADYNEWVVVVWDWRD